MNLVIKVLPNYIGYKDRYEVFCNRATKTKRVALLLLHGNHPKTKKPFVEQYCCPKKTNFFSRQKYLRKLIKILNRRFDKIIVHETFYLNFFWADPIFFLFNSRCKIILSLFNPEAKFLFLYFFIRIKDKPFFPDLKWIFQKYVPSVMFEFINCIFANKITGNSKVILNNLNRFYFVPKNKLYFVPGECNLRKYRSAYLKFTQKKVFNGIKTILFIGNFESRKGIYNLLATFKYLSFSVNFQAICIGAFIEPGIKQWVNNYILSNNLKSFVSFQSFKNQNSLYKYFFLADIFFFPTILESSPRVVREAIAFGLPIVASNNDAIDEVDPNKKFIYRPHENKPEMFAYLIKSLLTSSKNIKSNKFSYKFLKSFNIPYVSSCYEKVYQAL